MRPRRRIIKFQTNEASRGLRNGIGVGLLGAAFAFLAGAIIVAQLSGEKSLADPNYATQVALGKSVYDGR